MKIKQIHKGRLYSAIFSEEHIKKWDPLIKGALLKEIKGMSEYDRLLCIWNNPKYLYDYFASKKKYLDGSYYDKIPIADAGDMTQNYIDPFFDKLDSPNLEEVFKTLHDKLTDKDDDRFKHKIKETKKDKNWLRIYAVRLEENVFVITGGAIKLWEGMDEDDVTIIELEKIKMVKNLLAEEMICDLESLDAYVLDLEL